MQSATIDDVCVIVVYHRSEATVLLSSSDATDDSETLLTSFALEQVQSIATSATCILPLNNIKLRCVLITHVTISARLQPLSTAVVTMLELPAVAAACRLLMRAV
jgi:hypothetical protein